MTLNTRSSALMASVLLFLLVSTSSHANLVSNGTFDTDVSGWDQGGTLGTSWDAGSASAHLGRPGTPGTSFFSQEFAASENLEVAFDYQWQINSPAMPDFFSAYILFEGAAGVASRFDLINVESSDDASFGTTVSATFSAILSDLSSANAALVFELVENNQNAGTRIQLDNISVNAVPVPATFLLTGLGILGLFATRKKAA